MVAAGACRAVHVCALSSVSVARQAGPERCHLYSRPRQPRVPGMIVRGRSISGLCIFGKSFAKQPKNGNRRTAFRRRFVAPSYIRISINLALTTNGVDRWRSGALDTRTMPLNGSVISIIKPRLADTATAHNPRVAMTVMFGGANSPKLPTAKSARRPASPKTAAA